MSHHPNKIKNPAKWRMSYRPFVTLNVVELNREDPASEPGLSPLRSQPLISKVVILDEVQNLRSCLAIQPVNSKGTPPQLTSFVYNKTPVQFREKLHAHTACHSDPDPEVCRRGKGGKIAVFVLPH
jgi:hypothetical protein